MKIAVLLNFSMKTKNTIYNPHLDLRPMILNCYRLGETRIINSNTDLIALRDELVEEFQITNPDFFLVESLLLMYDTITHDWI